MNGDETRTGRDTDTLRACLRAYLETGDEEAMEAIVRRTRPALLRVARRIGSPTEAEDAVQTAYFSLLRKRGESLDIPVLPWLKTAVVRIAYRQKAARQRQHEIARRLSRPAESSSPLAEIAKGEEAVRVRREIARLPSTYRDPIVLRYLQGLSTTEVAELLGIPEATVRTRLHRARALLRGRLPAPLRYAVVCVPWAFADAARALRGALAQLTLGVSVPAPLAATAVLAAAGLGTILGVFLPETAPLPVAGARASSRSALVEENAALREEEAELAHRLEEARFRRRTALSLLAIARGELRALFGSPASVLPAAGPPGPPPVPVDGFEEPLAVVDWHLVGAALQELARHLDGIAENHLAGEDLGPTSLGRAQELNGILVQLTARMQHQLGEEEYVRVVLHPVYVVNALASALRAGGRPLTEEQTARLELAAAAAVGRDGPPVADETEFALAGRIRLAERRRGFFEQVREALDPDQLGTIRPERLRGRFFVDLLSVSHTWHDGLILIGHRREEDLEPRLLEKLSRVLDLTTAQQDEAGPLIRAWIADLPAEERSRCDDLSRLGWIPLEWIRSMAPRSLRLYRTLDDEMHLSDGQRDQLRRLPGPVVPLRLR